jgi:hypothetical protein
MLIRKIPVQFLLECLNDLERAGIEYIDVVTEQKKRGDWLGIIINENYPCSEGKISVAFNGENINDLIV